MHASQKLRQKRNLLLAFDAFGTLFYPKQPIPKQYGQFAERYGIECSKSNLGIKDTFKAAFKDESRKNPNYGKETGLGAEQWWANVITKTFQPYLQPDQQVPQGLVNDLLTRFSTSEGYSLYTDVLPFFQMLRSRKSRSSESPAWPWEKTTVGIITNSDSRVPGILESFGLNVGPRRVGSTAQHSREGSLNDDFSFVVLSYDVGYEKPDRRMFDAAIDMLEETLIEGGDAVQRSSTDEFEKLYVGDSLEKDYHGASQAGWNAVLLDRQNQNDNLQDSPIARVYLKSEAEGGEAQQPVYAIRDLGVLSQWRAHEL